MNREDVLLFLKSVLAEETGKPAHDLAESQSFHSLGLDSISIIVVLDSVENKYMINITSLDFWDHPTIGALADFITTRPLKKNE